MHGGNRRRAGEAHPHCLGHAGDRARRAHHHARAGGGRESRVDGVDLVLIDVARTKFRPETAAIGARAKALSLMRSRQHRSSGDDDRGNVGRRDRHQLRGYRLVAAADQHDRVDRLRADHLLGIERHQVAQVHAGRIRERLGSRSSGTPSVRRRHDAALHRGDQLRNGRGLNSGVLVMPTIGRSIASSE